MKKRQERKCIPLRMSPEDAELIDRALELVPYSKNAFILAAALDRARKVIKNKRNAPKV